MRIPYVKTNTVDTMMTDEDFEQFIQQAEMNIQFPNNMPANNNNSNTLAIAKLIYQKIDIEGAGFINRNMLKRYCQQVIEAVSPGQPFDEAGFENGFKALDQD